VTSPVVTMGQNDELHSGIGWYPLEEELEPLRWTLESAELFLRATGGEDCVVAEVHGGPAAIGPVTVTLRCGEAQQHYPLPSNAWTPLRLAIAPCEAGAELRVLIEVDRLRCPLTLGFNQDSRQLGVMVRRVALETGDPSKQP